MLYSSIWYWNSLLLYIVCCDILSYIVRYEKLSSGNPLFRASSDVLICLRNTARFTWVPQRHRPPFRCPEVEEARRLVSLERSSHLWCKSHEGNSLLAPLPVRSATDTEVSFLAFVADLQKRHTFTVANIRSLSPLTNIIHLSKHSIKRHGAVYGVKSQHSALSHSLPVACACIHCKRIESEQGVLSRRLMLFPPHTLLFLKLSLKILSITFYKSSGRTIYIISINVI